MTIKDKLRAVKEAIGQIEKQFGAGSIMQLGDGGTPTDVPAISTGCPSLDRALGCRGYPRGRIVEIYGPESSGKTTLTLHAIAECQKAGGVAAFIDAEHALDPSYARALGVKLEDLIISQPDHGEQALDILETLVRSGAFDLVVVDSVAALVPKAEIEGEMGDNHVGLQARLMSRALRKVTGLTHRSETTIMFINQLRTKIGVMFGSPETTTGGNALKYYASVRLDIRRIGPVKIGDEIKGNRTRVKVVKNKLAPPFKSTEFDIRYGTGIDTIGDLIDAAVDAGVLTKNGAYYTHAGKSLAQGRERAREALLANAETRSQIEQGVRIVEGFDPAQERPAPAAAAKDSTSKPSRNKPAAA
ncbi:MAG: recombinase RecA [Myxococcales bacterium]|nr:recombinase RecA [Myxococcales bacterium]MDD9965864.1 recombinase RecA [Myxococcales bacterium]